VSGRPELRLEQAADQEAIARIRAEAGAGSASTPMQCPKRLDLMTRPPRAVSNFDLGAKRRRATTLLGVRHPEGGIFSARRCARRYACDEPGSIRSSLE